MIIVNLVIEGDLRDTLVVDVPDVNVEPIVVDVVPKK